MKIFPDPAAVVQILRDARRRELRPDGYVQASVLVPLLWRGGDYDVLLTQRTEDVETHKGQVSFPGGVREKGDRTAVETALREAEEELQLPAAAVHVAGLLDDMAIPTGFLVTPVVGLLEHLPPLVPNAAEVVDAFYVPLSFFADGKHGEKEVRRVGEKAYEVWHYTTGGRLIWGATAAIIRGLVDRLASTSPRTPPRQE
jgi:8-oxo-dGTP pyrophosphatase MutT (NUDIX family)